MSEHDYNPHGLNETLARVETKLDAMLVEQKSLRSDHEYDRERINALERWRSWNMGFAAACSGIAVKLWLWFKGGPG